MRELIKELSFVSQTNNIKAMRKGKVVDLNLINQFSYHKFIPNKWFDWERRANAKIMIIGQDWGPYLALKEFIDDYEIEKILLEFDYDKFLFKTFSSRTEKFIIQAIEKTYFENLKKAITKEIWDEFFFTVSVLFTRQGKLFRGNNNFEPKQSFEISYPYLAKQISIVKPKIIMSLGNMAWESVKRYYNLNEEYKNMNITKVINKVLPKGYIKINDVTLIPNFHPASHVNPKTIYNQFKLLWVKTN